MLHEHSSARKVQFPSHEWGGEKKRGKMAKKNHLTARRGQLKSFVTANFAVKSTAVTVVVPNFALQSSPVYVPVFS